MALEFFNADDITRNAKCTIHKSGKLGFSMDANELMNLDENKSISLAMGKDYDETRNLYAKVNEGEISGAFSVNKAGDYYYLNTKNLFNKLGENFQNEKIIYDIVKTEYDGVEIFKLARRAIRKKT